MDAGLGRIRVIKSHTGADVTGEVLEAVEGFLQKRASELDVPLDPRDIQIRIFAEHLEVKAAWVTPVKLPDRVAPLTSSLQQGRKAASRPHYQVTEGR